MLELKRIIRVAWLWLAEAFFGQAIRNNFTGCGHHLIGTMRVRAMRLRMLMQRGVAVLRAHILMRRFRQVMLTIIRMILILRRRQALRLQFIGGHHLRCANGF